MAGESNFDFGQPSSEARSTSEGQGRDAGASKPSFGNFAFGGAPRNPADHAPGVAKRRGRPPLPRDASGEPIRPAASVSAPSASAASTSGKEKAGVAVSKFVKNDRAKLEQQIAGMHQAAAVLTKQPIFALNPMEAKGLTNALSDVLDYHEIDLTAAGGVGGLYLALGLTVFGIYKPRLDFIKNGGIQPPPKKQAAVPSTPGDARFAPGKMDFTGNTEAPLSVAPALVLDPATVTAADQTKIVFN